MASYTSTSPGADVRHYLMTGDHDCRFRAWPGSSIFDVMCKGDAGLRAALVAEVLSRSASTPLPPAVLSVDAVGLARAKLAPMVQGLFPVHEQAMVLAMLERSVVFLTPGNIESVLLSMPWLHTAWSLANLYLASIGAEMLSDEASAIVGLSHETTCFVSVDYFRDQDPCADYVVHEAAHIFHNCKRKTIGLPETRRREWLLEIDFCKRETFAYACEAYSRILALGETAARRRAALAAHGVGPLPGRDTVDGDEYLDILRQALAARNGWKRILQRCAPAKPRRASAVLPTSVTPPEGVMRMR